MGAVIGCRIANVDYTDIARVLVRYRENRRGVC